MIHTHYLRNWCSGLLLLCLLAVSSNGLAALTQQHKLLDSGGSAGDRFGTDAALSGSTAVVGAPENTNGKGAAIVFEKNAQGEWAQVAILTASDGAEGDAFGWRVAASGDVVVVGTNGLDVEKAYVFVKPSAGWADMTETVALQASDYSSGQRQNFGASVAVENDDIVVGAPGRDSFKGAVYLYTRPATGWADAGDEAVVFVASDGANGDQLGKSLAIDSGMVVAGARNADSDTGSGLVNVGAVYLFEKTGVNWPDGYTDVKLVSGDDLEKNGHFGHALDVDGDTVVVGKEGTGQQGRVYVFEKPATGWVDATPPKAVLSQSDRDSFGGVVAVLGGLVMASDTTQRVNGNLQGVVYLYEKPATGWQTTSIPDSELTASDPGFGDFFGSSLAMENDIALIGAMGDDIDTKSDQGSVYVFAPPLPDSPEIVVSANGNNIENDGRSPSAADGTDVGVVEANHAGIVITFTVTNTGSDVLNLGDVFLEYPVSGTTSQDIYLNPPASKVLAVGENTTFLVIVAPKSVGLHSAVVNIPSNDADESLFRVAVQGTGGPGLTVALTGKYGTVTSDKGGIACSHETVNCHEAYDLNEQIVLEVAPDSGATLSPIAWGGDCAGATGDTCDLLMDDTKNVSVDFTCVNLKLSAIVVRNESWDCVGIETAAGFWVPAPAAGITNEAVLRASDHVILGRETRVMKGGVLGVQVTP
ncbi:choice-of-anchor D domain-containing protein [Thiolapillus sp.]